MCQDRALARLSAFAPPVRCRMTFERCIGLYSHSYFSRTPMSRHWPLPATCPRGSSTCNKDICRLLAPNCLAHRWRLWLEGQPIASAGSVSGLIHWWGAQEGVIWHTDFCGLPACPEKQQSLVLQPPGPLPCAPGAGGALQTVFHRTRGAGCN